ncbi:hypothetical protein [Kordiimonas sp.]|uniref:hypothetical protein n=1 Tax=Kordiimonas sp. TaxID=1970157 RepID=UPI003A8E9711
MTRNMIFAGGLAGVIGLVAITGLLTGPDSGSNNRVIDHEEGTDEIVIQGSSRGVVIRSNSGDANCDKDKGSIEVSRENGRTTTITCY